MASSRRPNAQNGTNVVTESPATSSPVAASAIGAGGNRLQLNMVFLPLGREAEDEQARGPESHFWFVIPTKHGGDFVLTHLGNGALSLLTGDGTLLESGGSTLSFTFKRGVFGKFFVLSIGGAPRRVSCTFIQTGFARESSALNATPIVPWNFHFWPWARKLADGTPNPRAAEAEQILRKYARAFGKDEDFAAEWEHNNHGVDVGVGWGGHCHLAAGASILFDQPVARTVSVKGSRVAQVAFTEDELEFLATEWYGNFCDKKPAVYSLGEGAVVWQRIPSPNLNERRYVEMLKPSDVDRGQEELKAVFRKAVIGYDSSLEPRADAMAERAAILSKTEVESIKETFGQRGRFLYQTLIDEILVNGQMLEGDLRAGGSGKHGPEQVWNHAVFYYEAHYKALPESDGIDPFFVEVTILMVANADHPEPPSPGSPAEVTVFPSGRIVVDVNQTRWLSRKIRQIVNLVFSGAGDLVEDRKRNRWLHAQNGDGSAELYAPSYLALVEQVQTAPGKNSHVPDGDDRFNGNIVVGLDLVNAPDPLLKIRKRYRE